MRIWEATRFEVNGCVQADVELSATNLNGSFYRATTLRSRNGSSASEESECLCRWSEVSGFSEFTCKVKITTVGAQPPAPQTAPDSATTLGSSAVSNILQRLIEGDDVIDTRFLLFSQRHSHTHPDGQVSIGARAPRGVYANAIILSSISEYFKNCTFHSKHGSGDCGRR